MLDDLGWRSLYRFNDLQKEARKEAAERYPESTLEDGHGDAFRHAYWNALGAKHMGPKWMEQFGTAHEGRPGNQATREAMDLYNNEVGRRIAAHNPDASDDELADLIEAAIENGELLVIDSKGNLAWSDEVALDETGRAESSAPIAPAIDTPDGDAKAEY